MGRILEWKLTAEESERKSMRENSFHLTKGQRNITKISMNFFAYWKFSPLFFFLFPFRQSCYDNKIGYLIMQTWFGFWPSPPVIRRHEQKHIPIMNAVEVNLHIDSNTTEMKGKKRVNSFWEYTPKPRSKPSSLVDNWNDYKPEKFSFKGGLILSSNISPSSSYKLFRASDRCLLLAVGRLLLPTWIQLFARSY